LSEVAALAAIAGAALVGHLAYRWSAAAAGQAYAELLRGPKLVSRRFDIPAPILSGAPREAAQLDVGRSRSNVWSYELFAVWRKGQSTAPQHLPVVDGSGSDAQLV